MKYEQHDQVDFRGKSPKDLTGRECWPGQPFIPEDVSSETSLQKSRTLINPGGLREENEARRSSRRRCLAGVALSVGIT